jgi:uncharacterized membrane protein
MAAPTTIEHESIEHRRRKPYLSHWDAHPGVRSGDQLTVGEKAADALRNGMGSWFFVFGALAFLAVWMIFNRGSGFDPFPFILLNLVLSCLAAMQGAILLIAAKRSDEISSELAQHDFQTDERAAERIENVHQRLEEIATRNQELLEQNVTLLRQLSAALDGAKPSA